MQVTDVFSWRPAKEISIEELQHIFIEYYNERYTGKYVVSMEMPNNVDDNILHSTEELIGEGRNIAYILECENVIAVIGYH